MGSDRRSVTTGVIIFVILVVGAYLAVREVASAELRKVTSTPPAISFPTPSFTVAPPSGFTWSCSGSAAATPRGSSTGTPGVGFCRAP